MSNYSVGVYSDGREEGREDTLLDSIKNLIQNLHMTAEQAMTALGIPTEERKKYLKMLADG